MDVVTILLKYLKRKGYINDVERAKNEIETKEVKLRKPTDLFIRDSLMKMGTILKEDLNEHYYIAEIKTGFLGNNHTQTIVLRQDEMGIIAVYAREGIIKQHLADKTVEKLIKVLS